MGFSTIGAGVILLVGALLAGTMLLNATFDAQRLVVRGIEEDRDLRALAHATKADLKDVTHRPNGVLHVNVTNTGGATLDPGHVAVLLDGSWAAVIGYAVEGRAGTEVWAPQEVLHVRVDAPVAPQRVYLILETGLGLTWAPA